VIWYVVVGVASLLVGVGGTVALTPKAAPVEPVVVVPNEKVQEQLSNLDIVMPVCTTEFIQQNGDGLCREMFCFAQSNSTVGAAGEKGCDAISNINNTKVILATCGTLESPARVECFQTFRERK
jgi:hypothetical protein